MIEDDPHQARIILGLARDTGFKVIVATRGATGLSLARQYRPDAISLDIYLPDMLGWTVLNNLKSDPATRHIPVQIITVDEERQSILARGAFPTSSNRRPPKASSRLSSGSRASRPSGPSGCSLSRITTSSDNPSSSCSMIRISS